MKRLILLLTTALMAVAPAMQAQMKISLDEAIHYALRNRYDAKANQLDVALAENDVKKSKNEWLPEINATGDLHYNTRLQTMIFGGGEAFKMGTTNLTTLSLNLSQPLYRPGLSNDIKISKVVADEKREAVREKESDIRLNVTTAYLDVILRGKELALSKDNAARYKALFSLAQDKRQLGTILESDLMQAQTDYENASIYLQKAEQNYDLALQTLKYNLNVRYTEELVLTDSVPILMERCSLKAEESNTEELPELRRLRLSMQENDLRLRKSNLAWLPTVSFIANYTTEQQADNFRFAADNWFPYNYIGLKVSLPVSNLFKRNTDRTHFREKSAQLALQYNQKRHELNYERNKRFAELANAAGNISTSEKTLALSRRLYERKLNAYHLGTITYSAMLDSERAINTAEQNYITAVYDYLVAYAQYHRAIGH